MNKAAVKYIFYLSSTFIPLKEKKHFNLLYSFLVSLIIPFSILDAADFQKGFEAHLKGDYISAIKEWGPLAAQGDAAAQFNIGNMFDFGKESLRIMLRLCTGIINRQNRVMQMHNMPLAGCMKMVKV